MAECQAPSTPHAMPLKKTQFNQSKIDERPDDGPPFPILDDRLFWAIINTLPMQDARLPLKQIAAQDAQGGPGKSSFKRPA